MNRNEVAALAKGMAPVVREIVTETMVLLTARVADLEARPIEKGDPGERGADGPQGESGPPGLKGDPADMIVVSPDLAEQVKAAIHMLHESPPIVAREAAPRPPAPAPRVARIERDETGAFVPIYDDDLPAEASAKAGAAS